MNVKFLKRLVVTASVLTIGVLLVQGETSLFDRIIIAIQPGLAVLVTITISVFLFSLGSWCMSAWRWSAPRHRPHGYAVTVLAVCAIGAFSACRSEAWIGSAVAVPDALAGKQIMVSQGFVLPIEQQAQVNEAVETVIQSAKDGFLITVELVCGVAIAAVVFGTVLYIIVRCVVKTLSNLKTSISNRMEKAIGTNDSVAGLFFNGFKTMSEMPPAIAPLTVNFTAGEPDSIVASRGPAETVSFSEWASDFGLVESLPKDTCTDSNVIFRETNAIKIAPAGFTNHVSVAFSRTIGAVKDAGEHLFTLIVPQGARILFSDSTVGAESVFYRIQTSQ